MDKHRPLAGRGMLPLPTRRRESPAEPRPSSDPRGGSWAALFWAAALGVACCKGKATGPWHAAGRTPASQAAPHEATRELGPTACCRHPALPARAPRTEGLRVPSAGPGRSGEPQSSLAVARASESSGWRGAGSPGQIREVPSLSITRQSSFSPMLACQRPTREGPVAVPSVREPTHRRHGASRAREHSQRGPSLWPLHFSVKREPAAHG